MSHYHIACQLNACNIVKKYLEKGVSANLQIRKKNDEVIYSDYYEEGDTALHIGGYNPKFTYFLGVQNSLPTFCLEVVQLLCEKEAELDIENACGKITLQLSSESVEGEFFF